MIEIVLILMVVLAIFAVQTKYLRRAIVFLCVFSLLCSLSYLLYQAPDVAIAEAIIGSTLSTIIYLVAYKKYKIFRVYYTLNNASKINKNRLSLNKYLETFSFNKELELDTILTDKKVKEIESDYSYDIIVQHTSNNTILHGDKSNYHFDDLAEYLMKNYNEDIKFNYLIEGEDDDIS